jgi:hypothetical protein
MATSDRLAGAVVEALADGVGVGCDDPGVAAHAVA